MCCQSHCHYFVSAVIVIASMMSIEMMNVDAGSVESSLLWSMNCRGWSVSCNVWRHFEYHPAWSWMIKSFSHCMLVFSHWLTNISVCGKHVTCALFNHILTDRLYLLLYIVNNNWCVKVSMTAVVILLYFASRWMALLFCQGSRCHEWATLTGLPERIDASKRSRQFLAISRWCWHYPPLDGLAKAIHGHLLLVSLSFGDSKA